MSKYAIFKEIIKIIMVNNFIFKQNIFNLEFVKTLIIFDLWI